MKMIKCPNCKSTNVGIDDPKDDFDYWCHHCGYLWVYDKPVYWIEYIITILGLGFVIYMIYKV